MSIDDTRDIAYDQRANHATTALGDTIGVAAADRSLADLAYLTIKRAIIRCDLEPGGQTSEAKLARRYKVGRAAVRAALKRLCQDKLVQVSAGQRYSVAPITLEHVQELFEMRLLIEPAAARRAAGRLDSRQLRRLEELCAARYDLADQASLQRFLEHNTEFHGIVARASGNSMLADAAVALLEQSERIHNIGHRIRDRNEDAFHEHHDLMEALVAADGERAEAIMVAQLEAVRRFVFETLIASPSIQTVNVAAGLRSAGGG